MNSKKRKEIYLSEDTITLLEMQAEREGRKLKNFIEFVLQEKAHQFQLTEAYKQMMDGALQDFHQQKLSFTDWQSLKMSLMDNVSFTIYLSKEAQLQLTEAILYYATINEKLGAKFKTTAIKLIDSLQKDAFIYQIR
ncbi:MAG: hypothetical protein HC798_01180, partial [Polaribacter sp.]|nr:hypothetical protein [Polaribacter sp.]